jgi:hypothetical protein
VDRRRKQLEESVAGYFSQLDTADLQEPSKALAAKTGHLKEKIAKTGEEMKKLETIEKQMLASPANLAHRSRQPLYGDEGARRLELFFADMWVGSR